MKFSIFQDSRIGGRATNEDRIGYRYTREALAMVVADGLGGHGHGEVAAEAAVRSIVATFDQQATPRLADPGRFLADAMSGAHSAVVAQSGIRQLDDLPRTTCVVCVVQDGIALWAHCGDSRLYHLRNGRLVLRTQDHSRVQDLVGSGLLSKAAAQTHPARNLLSTCLGSDLPPRFEFSARTPLRRGDVLLLCTDGVWGALADDAALIALSARDAVRAAPGLLDRIEAGAGPTRDNLSLLVLAWQEDTPQWTADDFSRTLNTTHSRLHDKDST